MPYQQIVQQVLAGIAAAIAAYPQIADIVTSGKAMITALFEGKVISVEDQTAAHGYIDALALMYKQGLIPPALQVQPDPGTVTTTTTVPAAPAKP